MMTPTLIEGFLAKRQNNNNNINGNNDEYCDFYGCYSSWDSWGRWVTFVLIVIAILLLAFVFSCITSRRRRRRGMQPMYGTGWMASKPPVGQQYGNANNYYSNEPYHGGAQAPPYSPPVNNQHTGNTFNSNDGYYGQQSGIELQTPQSAYQPQRGGDPVYDPPQGPPPGKDGYVVR